MTHHMTRHMTREHLRFRSQSNYPVYQRDNLFNSNPTFDYGDFEELEYYILNTNVTYNSFAYVFSDAGTYVFADSQDATRFD